MNVDGIKIDEINEAIRIWSGYVSKNKISEMITTSGSGKRERVFRLLEIVAVVLDKQDEKRIEDLKNRYKKSNKELEKHLKQFEKIINLDLTDMTLREILDFDFSRFLPGVKLEK